jgi:MoaA/NifB/PqqE/SkfB family radical SAM enzyme
LAGAFERSLGAVRLLRERGVKVGLRYTMTAMNAHDLPALLQLMRDEEVDKFYFSHLNYAGRGNIHRAKDARFAATRDALDLLFDEPGKPPAPGATRNTSPATTMPTDLWLLHWVQREPAAMGNALREHLVAWGGNSSGVNVANIDNLGHVHPDTMWWHHDLGNVRERPFSAIWSDTTEPLMAGLKARPRPVQGPLRIVRAPGHLRWQHARAGPAGHGRSLGRGSGLLPR